MKQNQIILAVVLAVVAGGAGFFGGMQYQKSKIPTFGNGARTGQVRMGTNRNGFRPVAGEILNADDNSITVKLIDGSSKIVLVNDKTTIGKTSEASKTDLKTGEKVSVFGTENNDGSVSAQNIQLNPDLGRMMQTSPMPTK